MSRYTPYISVPSRRLVVGCLAALACVSCKDQGESRAESRPSQPPPGVLAGLLGDDGVFRHGGAPILDATVASLRTTFGDQLSRESGSYRVALPATSLGSAPQLVLDVHGDTVAGYRFQLDYGAAGEMREVVVRALDRALGGRGRAVRHGALACSAYPVPGDRSPSIDATCAAEAFACERAEVAVCESEALEAVAVFVSRARPPIPRADTAARELAARAWHLDQRAALPEPAREPSATLLADGRVLLVGGIHWEERRDDAILHDPENGAVEVVDGIRARTRGHTATQLADGSVLVAGGSPADVTRFHISTAATARLDLAGKRWRASASMAEARYGHSAFLLPDGRVLVFGGTRTGSEFLRSCEFYDPRSDRWSPGPELHQGRWQHAAVRLQNGDILVAGSGEPGAEMTSEVFEVESGTWRLSGALNRAWYGHGMTLLADGRAWLLGESYGADGARPHLGSELYDPDLGAWTLSIADDRRWSGFSVASVAGGVLVVGGHRPVQAKDGGAAVEKLTETLFFAARTERLYLGPGLPTTHTGDAPRVVAQENGDLLLYARTSPTPLLLR